MKLNVGDIVFIKNWNDYAIVLDKRHGKIKLSIAGITIVYHYYWLENCDIKIQSQMKILCKHSDFIKLQKLYGIGTFFHDYSPLYNKICVKKPKFITFKDLDTKETITFHLAKAMKVLKKIGETHNSNYERVRIVKPMVKLQFIGEL